MYFKEIESNRAAAQRNNESLKANARARLDALKKRKRQSKSLVPEWKPE